jgi:hypothetical protein
VKQSSHNPPSARVGKYIQTMARDRMLLALLATKLAIGNAKRIAVNCHMMKKPVAGLRVANIGSSVERRY